MKRSVAPPTGQLAETATVLPYKSLKLYGHSFLVAAGSWDPSPVLQPAVDRQPGHRREDREELGRNIP